jgi:lysozyme family protein
MGVSRAVEFLQTSLNCLNKNQELYEDLVVDGKFGMKTLTALTFDVKRKETALIVKMLNVLQGAYYIDIMRKSPTQEKFARGWFSRVEIQKVVDNP